MTDADWGTSNDPMGGADLADFVTKVVDDNVYLVLGTADRAGRPWVSPVFYAAEAYRDFYWISSPDVIHSRNLAVRPKVTIVVFDSRAPVGMGGARAVYMAATATEVPADDLDRRSPSTRAQRCAADGSSRRRTSVRPPPTGSIAPA
jgi:Pyridoxamine 5'-phosphate oxidase